MRSSALSLVLLCLLLAVHLPLAAAQGVDPGDVVLAGDAAGTQWAIEVPSFGPFEFYVVGFELEGGVQGVEWGLSVPPDWTLLDFDLPREVWVNIGTPTNVIAGLESCLDGSGAVTLARYEGGFFVSDPNFDAVFCLGPADPSSASPPAPAYVRCDDSVVPFGIGQGGQGIYPSGCLIVNPTNSPPCATLVQRQSLVDVLVPAGGTSTVAYGVLEEVLVSSGPTKAACAYPSFTAVDFTLRFDPTLLEWSEARLPARYTDFPLEVSVAAPGEIHVVLGPNATFLELYESPRDLVLLDLVMNAAGGTATVAFEEARLLNEYGQWVDLDPVSILVSDDPIVSVESSSFGAIKARYQ